MNLNILPPENCAYDAVALGEVMLRMDPGEGRIRTSRTFFACEGGGEYNVVRGLRKCFGMRTAIVTALARNEIGSLIEDLILQGGVDTRLIKWFPTDGFGEQCRNGINFTERGFGIRGAKSCSDRAHTAISQAVPEDFQFEALFGEQRVRWLHTGGVYAGLSEQSLNTLITALKTAKKYGTVISYDLNYRASVWERKGGLAQAQRINRMIIPFIDVLIGVFRPSDGDRPPQTKSLEYYRKAIEEMALTYPNLKVIASTTRRVKTASINDWGALCWSDGELYQSKAYENLAILDRVGGGDSFASGLIYGLMTGKNIQTALELGAAHGALTMTTLGDTSMAGKEEVEALAHSNYFNIIR